MKRFWHIILLGLLLFTPVLGDDNEAYTKVLDRLTSVPHFSDRPVLFILGFDTTKSMSVEFDRSKRVSQLILSRYGAPGDQIYVFGFANTPSVLPATASPKTVPSEGAERLLATINEGILSLPRSSEFGTVFGRAKLFALEKAQEFGSQKNVIVLLFSDNNSELEMGTDERRRLESLEKSVASSAETIPLLSQGASPLWMTLYTNSFPDATKLVGPDGKTDLDNPRLAWAARRMGSQVLEFIEPAAPRIESFPTDVSVQFLGPVQPKEASLTVNGKLVGKSDFEDGRASWSLDKLDPGSHLLFAQAVLPDGKVRTAELPVTVGRGAAKTPVSDPTSPPPDPANSLDSATPTASPILASEGEEGSIAPFILLALLAALAGAVFLLSTKPARVRVIGPNSEESYLLPKGRTLRIGGVSRVEGELIYSDTALSESIATVTSAGFGKARVAPSTSLKDGTVEVETDEGQTVLDSGETLLTSATITWTSPRGAALVYTVVKEDSASQSVSDEGHFGGGTASSADDDSGDWRA